MRRLRTPHSGRATVTAALVVLNYNLQASTAPEVSVSTNLEALEAEALKLTSGERAAFAQLLLASLDEDAEIEEAWAAEVERRIADVENGVVQVIPIADALAQVRARLR